MRLAASLALVAVSERGARGHGRREDCRGRGVRRRRLDRSRRRLDRSRRRESCPARAVVVGSIAVVVGSIAVVVGSIAVVVGSIAVVVGSIAVVVGSTAVVVGRIVVVGVIVVVVVGVVIPPARSTTSTQSLVPSGCADGVGNRPVASAVPRNPRCRRSCRWSGRTIAAALGRLPAITVVSTTTSAGRGKVGDRSGVRPAGRGLRVTTAGAGRQEGPVVGSPRRVGDELVEQLPHVGLLDGMGMPLDLLPGQALRVQAGQAERPPVLVSVVDEAAALEERGV